VLIGCIYIFSDFKREKEIYISKKLGLLFEGRGKL